MTELLHNQVERCFQQAEFFFQRSFSRPAVSFKLRGQKAGVAHLQDNLLRFNYRLYQENKEHFLHQTVAHEVAHLVAFQIFGLDIKAHGREWQAIMRKVYGLTPDRCHDYAIARQISKHYLYRCHCPEQLHPLSARRHTLISQGNSYRCRRCGQTLKFTGQSCRR